MATIMEKDVLIEIQASASARIFHYEANNKISQTEKINIEKDSNLINLFRVWLYKTSAESIDYKQELEKIMGVRAKYLTKEQLKQEQENRDNYKEEIY